MKTFRRGAPVAFPLLALIACASGMYVQSSGAQTPDEPESPSWQIREEVLVTADRENGYVATDASVVKGGIPLQDWPQSVQVLNRTLLEEQNVRSLTEALQNVSGVIPNHEQETVLVNPFVRGLEAEIFLDGLVGYGDTAVIDPSTMIVFEQVEVAKGPTSVQYGGGVGAPTGGLINLVTKTPKSEASYYLGARAGSFDTTSVEADLNQPVNDKVAVRLAGEWFESDDMIDSVDIERLTLNPSLSAQLGVDTNLTVRGLYNRIEQLEYTGIPAEVARRPDVDDRQFSGAADAPRTEIENLSIHASVDHSFSESLSGTVQLRYFDSSFDEFSSFPFLSVFPLEGTSVPIIRGQLPVDTEEYTLDASLNYLFKTGSKVSHNTLLGVTYDATDYRAGSGFDFFPIGVLDYASGANTLSFGPIPAINSVSENEYRTIALYAQDQISVGERWNILLSGRLSEYGLEEIVGGQGADESYTEFDTRLGVTYHITDEVALFAGYATGSRVVPFFAGVDSVPPVPEESESLEAGLKLAAGQWSGSVAVFQLDRENIPQTDLTDPNFGSVQTGEQRSEGVEIDAVWEPTPSFSVLASAAYIDAKNQSDIVSFGTIFARGNQLSRIPETSGRVALRYRFLSGSLSGLGLGLGVTYADEAPLTDANVLFSDSYTVLDLQADYAAGPWTFRFNVVNLADEDYLKPYQYLLQEVARPGQELSAFFSVGVQI
ncbi:MAG: TonB-dependent receptor [Pseudomonadota bacterium]